jgi:hypothetical protein
MCVSFWVGLALGPIMRVGTMYLDAGFCAMAITHVWFYFTEQGQNPAWTVEAALVTGSTSKHAEEAEESTHG